MRYGRSRPLAVPSASSQVADRPRSAAAYSGPVQPTEVGFGAVL